MIDERKEELASLYVLGALTSVELEAFEAELKNDGELRILVDALRKGADAVAVSVPAKTPASDLKNRLMARLDAQSKIVTMPASQPVAPAGSRWLPWALAACLAVLVIYQQNQSFQAETAGQQAQLEALMLERQTLSGQATALTMKLERLDKLLQSSQSTNEILTAELKQIKESNRLANLRIAMLNTLLAESPKAIAVSVWDNQKQTGIFHVENLKPLPPGKDYQLWVIDPQYKTPVDAGVFQVDEKGNVRFEFKPRQPIAAANTFAVTEEPKGGRPTPTLDRMVLAGNAKEL